MSYMYRLIALRSGLQDGIQVHVRHDLKPNLIKHLWIELCVLFIELKTVQPKQQANWSEEIHVILC